MIKFAPFISDGSLPDPQRQANLPPSPIKPGQAAANRRGSGSTNQARTYQTAIAVKKSIKSFLLQTENTEKYEIDENSEFLQPVDSAPPVIVDEDDYQVHENCGSIDHNEDKERFF